MKSLAYRLIIIMLLSTMASCHSPFADVSLLNFAPAELAFDKKTYFYGEVGVGSVAVTKFTLYNTSQVEAVGCESLELSDTTNFSIYNTTCTKSKMGINDSCEVDVLSQPQSLGPKSLTLSRKCENTKVTTTENQITAIAIVPDLSWNPLSNNFGSVFVGSQSPTIYFTLTNNGTGTSTGCTDPVLTDNVNFELNMISGGGSTILSGWSVVVGIKAKPQSVGLKRTFISSSCTVGGATSTTVNQIQVEGVLTNLAWSPQTYDFGTVNVGNTTIDQQFNLSNTGSADATFCSLPVLSDVTNFSITSDTCGMNNVTVGGSCFVRVFAQPQSPGIKQTTLSRTCTVGGTVTTLTNQIVVDGSAASIVWAPQSHDFGTHDVGVSSTTQTFTLTNNTGLNQTMCWAPYTDDWSGTFNIVADTCGSNDLLASQSCSVDIRATPQQSGYTRTTLYRDCWSSGTYSTQSQQIVVRGNGPHLEANPTYLNLGSVDPGLETTVQNIIFTNTGTQSDMNCAVNAPWDVSNFTLVSSTCGTSIAAGANCTVSVKGHPQTSNNYGDNISYSCDNSYAGSNIEVTGNGPHLSWSPSPHDFGAIDVGLQTADQVFTITNSSSIAATSCSAPYLNYDNDFILMSTTCGTTLAGGASCTATVRGTPQSGGSLNDYLSYDCGNASAYANLSLTGNGPKLILYPSSGYFGNVNVGDTSFAIDFYFQNNGNADATGCSAATLSDTTNFSILNDSGGGMDLLANAGNAFSLQVQAHPTTSGIKQATLSRTCSVGGVVTTQTNGLEVNAVVNAPDLSWAPLTYDFGDVVVGSGSGVYNFVLTNNGTQPATSCSAPVLSDTTHFNIVWQNCNTNDVSAYGNSCTVQVRAVPASSGVKQANLSRTCVAGGTVSTTTNGIVVNGVLTASWQQEYGLSSLGEVRSGGGESERFKYFFLNENSETLSNCTSPILSNISDFTIVSNTCAAGHMSAKQICEVQIKANPLLAGNVTGTLSRTCDESGTDIISISAIGNDNSTPISISGSAYNNCVLTNNGGVRCWGANTSYSPDFVSPVNVSIITNATQISSGFTTMCALISDGTVKCMNGSSPFVVPGISNAIQVASSDWNNACAVISTGEVKCWDSALSVVTIAGITTANQIAAGYDAYGAGVVFCAVLNDGTIQCWGANGYGQLGNGTTTPSSVPVTVSGISNAVSVQTSGSHTCAKLSTGEVKCWGYGLAGQLGQGTIASSSTPVLVSGISNATKVVVGTYKSCALLNDSSIKCWGGNTANVFGQATATYSNSTPVVNTSLTGVADLSLGFAHLCVLKNDQSVKCTGWNNYSALGIFDYYYLIMHPPSLTIPYTHENLNNSLSVSGNCNVLSNGTIKCWDANNDLVGTLITGINTATQMIGTKTSGCALLSTGSVQCWGTGSYGELGNGSTTTSALPVNVSGISNATQITGALYHRCARLSTGEVKCWGYNQYGQLGDGSNTNRSTPVFVSGTNTAVKVKTGIDHSCAVLSDGSAQCWGGNLYGALGNGTNTDSNVPVIVSGISNAVNISLGSQKSCVSKSDGTVSCWGYNGQYELGDGTNINSNIPVQVSGLMNVIDVAMANGVSCSLNSSGEKLCWGGGVSLALPKIQFSHGFIIKLFDDVNACAELSTSEVQCTGRSGYRPFVVDLNRL